MPAEVDLWGFGGTGEGGPVRNRTTQHSTTAHAHTNAHAALSTVTDPINSPLPSLIHPPSPVPRRGLGCAPLCRLHSTAQGPRLPIKKVEPQVPPGAIEVTVPPHPLSDPPSPSPTVPGVPLVVLPPSPSVHPAQHLRGSSACGYPAWWPPPPLQSAADRIGLGRPLRPCSSPDPVLVVGRPG